MIADVRCGRMYIDVHKSWIQAKIVFLRNGMAYPIDFMEV